MFSNEIVLNSGCPQGCVLSPVLFSLYINDISCNDPILTLLKYADDMALIGRLFDEDSLAKYFLKVNELNDTLKERFLELNVRKTKELVCGKMREDDTLRPVVIDEKDVEIVHDFKYLGVTIDENLSFNTHAENVHKKAKQQLSLLRKLNAFDVSQSVLVLVYRCLVESILTSNITTWFDQLLVKQKTKLVGVVNSASKIIGRDQLQLSTLYHTAVTRKTRQILKDNTHPLRTEYKLLRSGVRYETIRAKKNIYKKSFIPNAVTVLNASLSR